MVICGAMVGSTVSDLAMSGSYCHHSATTLTEHIDKLKEIVLK